MTITVELPNGNTASFPDGTDKATILKAIEKKFPTTGMRGVAADVERGIAAAPGALVRALKELPGQALASGKQAVTHPVRAVENVLAGAGESLEGLVGLPKAVAQYAGAKGLPGAQTVAGYLPSTPDVGLEKELGLDVPQAGDPLLRGVGGFLPFEGIGRGAAGVSGALQRAGGAGLYGAAQQQNPLTAALLGGLAEGVPAAVGAGGRAIRGLRPSRFLRGQLSPEELARNLEVTRGTQTGLGDVIDSPALKRRLENVFTRLPLSGATEAMQQTANQVRDRGETLLTQLGKGHEGTNLESEIQEALKKAHADALKEGEQKYTEANKLADANNIKIGRSNLQQKALDALNEINESPELERTVARPLIKDLKFYGAPEASLREEKLKTSNILKGKLGDLASKNYQDGNKFESRIYGKLKKTLHQDIKDSISSANVPKLQEAYQDAEKFHGEKVAPFEEKDIAKYARRGGDPDLIVNAFLKRSKVSDRANLLSRLLHKLPENKKDLVALAYYKQAVDEGSLNPLKLKSLHKSLGPRQKEILIPDKAMRQDLDNYTKLVEKNTDPLNLMFNPRTGERVLTPAVRHMLQSAGALGGGAVGGLPGALAGAYAAPAALGVLSRPLVSALTSPAVRERLVRKMLKNEQTPTEDSILNLVKSLINARKLRAAAVPLGMQDQNNKDNR